MEKLKSLNYEEIEINAQFKVKGGVANESGGTHRSYGLESTFFGFDSGDEIVTMDPNPDEQQTVGASVGPVSS